ncbi:MAG TPA: glutaredoxin domain-containing protein [Bacteroidia bacterium]|nr:glutaredoxin domain-containing protein [Bacteroidia bacterium]
MTKVKIYSTPTCPFCKRAKEFFKKHNVEYEDVNVAENEKSRDEMVEKSGQMGVPVIEIGDKIIVGFDEQELKKALKVGGKK